MDPYNLQTALWTMGLTCGCTMLMGGPNHPEALSIIARLTGKAPERDAKCLCIDTARKANR